MDCKHIKVDKNQQIEKISPQFRILHVSHCDNLPSSALFRRNVLPSLHYLLFLFEQLVPESKYLYVGLQSLR